MEAEVASLTMMWASLVMEGLGGLGILRAREILKTLVALRPWGTGQVLEEDQQSFLKLQTCRRTSVQNFQEPGVLKNKLEQFDKILKIFHVFFLLSF